VAEQQSREPAAPVVTTDAQIQAIIDSNEPGIDALLTAYELVEQHYFSAVAGNTRNVATAANTSTT
jgi:hypothetical protein